LESDADEILYGGAAGGGKSEALLIEAMRDIAHPEYRGILFRRTYPELSMSLIDRSRDLYGGRGRYNEAQHTWVFPSGARIVFAHIQRELDVKRYQSAAFAFIGFDELTSFTQYQYEYMASRNRNTARLFNRIRSATNPGGVGHSWVKTRFIDRLEPHRVKWFVRRRGADVEVEEGTPNARSRQFIPAKVSDNPSLTDADPGYVARLEALPEKEAQMLLEGRWDVAFEGLVYSEFDSMRNVIDPIPIPKEWMRFRAVDFGYNNPFVCQWWALSPDDELHLYRELYVSHRLVSDLGPEINRLSFTGEKDKEGEPIKEKIVATVADHDAENRAELEIKHGIKTVPAVKDIREGISRCSVRLRADGTTGKPRILFHRGASVELDRRMLAAGHPTSTQEEIQVYQYPGPKEGRSPDEVPIDLHNHGMDAMRYMVQLVEHMKTGRTRARHEEGL
tara:strand:+ start:3617 stop:4963 length:1347 start_codon:yes stop_codon:yes gene_type:complete